MINKIKKKLSNNGTLFLLASLTYSASTFIIVFLIPYKLDLKMMADFSAALNIAMMLSFVFEFGVATSYLRYNQLYGVTKYINAYIQLGVFLLIFIVSQSFIGGIINQFMGMDNVNLNSNYLYLVVFAVLSWIFFKNIFLSNKNIKFIFYNSIFLTFVRISILIYILLSSRKFSTDEIFLYLFIAPFVLIMFINLKTIISDLIASFSYINSTTNKKLFFKRFKQIIIFSIGTYIIGIIFVYGSRYALIYLTKMNATQLIAEIGYAMSFGGIINMFSVSVRSYLISKFNISDVKAIKNYIDTMLSYKYKYALGAIVLSLLISLLVYVIKPNYMSFNTVAFVFILSITYFMTAYAGMFTLLSKTFNYNKLEIYFNITRLVLVMLFSYLLLIDYPILGFLCINISSALVVFVFAKLVLKKVDKRN